MDFDIFTFFFQIKLMRLDLNVTLSKILRASLSYDNNISTAVEHDSSSSVMDSIITLSKFE